MGWDVEVPVGWEPVAAICRAMFDDRAGITTHINERIRREVDALAERRSGISRSDIDWSTGGGVEHFLRGVASRRPTSDRDLRFQRLVGQRSAMAGVPLQPLIAAYHIGFRELWSQLASRAKGGPAADLLLERGSIVWERLGSTATAVSEGYQDEMARREAFGSTAMAHLLELLAHDPDTDESRGLARDLGFDPSGDLRAVALGGPIAVAHSARVLAGAATASGATAATTQRGRTAVVLVQGEASLDDALATLAEGTACGIGSRAIGLRGARVSLWEAERALAVGLRRQAVCRYDDEWLLATVVSGGEAGGEMLAAGATLATEHAHLAEAVRTFASAGFSVAESARAMNLSPNSVRYRLTRWRELTGWDPWDFGGLARSMVAIDLASLDG